MNPRQDDWVKGLVEHRLDSEPFTNIHPVQLVNCVYMSKSKL